MQKVFFSARTVYCILCPRKRGGFGKRRIIPGTRTSAVGSIDVKASLSLHISCIHTLQPKRYFSPLYDRMDGLKTQETFQSIPPLPPLPASNPPPPRHQGQPMIDAKASKKKTNFRQKMKKKKCTYLTYPPPHLPRTLQEKSRRAGIPGIVHQAKRPIIYLSTSQRATSTRHQKKKKKRTPQPSIENCNSFFWDNLLGIRVRVL